jgi:ParB family chromosome partitioning protein
MKRDLLFVVERLTTLLDENRLAVLAKQHGIKKTKDTDSTEKLLTTFLRRTDESTLGRAMVESIVLLAATRGNPVRVLQDAAAAYKVDTDAIALKVKQEFAAKENAQKASKSQPKPEGKPKKAA